MIAYPNGGSSGPPSQPPRDVLLEVEHIPLNRRPGPLGDEGSTSANSQTQGSSPRTVIPAHSNYPASALSDDEMVRLSDEWLQDEELNFRFSLLLHELVCTIPMVAQIVQEISNEVWRVHCTGTPNTPVTLPPGYSQVAPETIEDNSGITRPPYARFPVEFRQRQYEFVCLYCGKVYDRMTRARDCQYHDRKLTPYQCAGACGHGTCIAAYSSEERLGRHISAYRVQCPQCQKEVSRQNMARHRNAHCPNRDG